MDSTVTGVSRLSDSSRSTGREPHGSRRHRRSIGAVVAVAVAVGIMAAPSAVADDINGKKHRVDAQVEDAQFEVLAYNKKVARATRQVLDAREQLPEAQRNLKKATDARDEALDGRKSASAALVRAKSKVTSAERKLVKIEKEIDGLRADVGEFARRAYQMGPFARLEMLLGAQDPTEFTDKLAAIRSVSRASGDVLEEMNEDRANTLLLEARLGALRDAATEKKAVAKAQLEAAEEAAAGALAAKELVDALVAQERSALRVAKESRSEVKADYKKLAEEQLRLQKEIAAAARRLARQTGIRTDSSGGTRQWQWPLPGGSIGSEAGWRVHPILGYTRCHTGADISAPAGTAITAVEDGVVISAGDGGAFGNYTVISHGGNLTSSYAHQSSMVVSAGDAVKRGQVIGLVGSTGLSTGAHLHVEARVAGVPWDPRGWFGTGDKLPACM